MKRYILLLLALTFSFSAMAQTDLKAEYEAFKKKRTEEYNDFRAKANQEYAEYLKKRWTDYDVDEAVPAPIPDVSPKPEVAPKQEVEQTPEPTKEPETVQESETTQESEVAEEPQPQLEIPEALAEPEIPETLPEPENTIEIVKEIIAQEPPAKSAYDGKTLSVDFFGEALEVPCNKDELPYMSALNEQNFSVMWTKYSDTTSATVKFLEEYVASRHLNGWGCYQLVKRISEQAYDEKNPNERIALQSYLLSQLKYRAQVAMSRNDLVLLLPFNETIYGVTYLTVDGQKFYIFSYRDSLCPCFRTYNQKFEYADKIFSAALTGEMKIGEMKTMEFERLGAMLGQKLEAPIYMGTIGLLYSYPLLDNITYYKQGFSEEFATAILTPLREKIKGKSDTEAVHYLLNFVQNGFGYVDDMKVFGRQKQLFVEESFFYGQNNCKDRVGVFSWLVRELVGLDVIGVRFEGNKESNGIGHITCAIAFKEDVAGDYYTYKGKRYVVCDPTYINAGIGQAMPCYKNSTPEFVPISVK